MLARKLSQIFERIAENALCLGFCDGDLLVVGVDLQYVAGVDVEVATDILGDDDTACLVDFSEIGVNHTVASVLQFMPIFYHFMVHLSIASTNFDIQYLKAGGLGRFECDLELFRRVKRYLRNFSRKHR